MEDFDKAIEDTIIALNTGVLRTRDGTLLKQAQGKSAIQNPIWREKFELISDMLASLRRRLKLPKKIKHIVNMGQGKIYLTVFRIINLQSGSISQEKKYRSFVLHV